MRVLSRAFFWSKNMAERRMFAKTIIDSDAFLDMPLSTQALYFHLSMRADDDGFINNAKKIQRMLGCNDDDLKILLSKNFIIPFETGVCVIKHWKIHNLIQKDRYKPTVYSEHKEKLSLKNNNVYTMDTLCIQDVYSMEPQVSIGKVSLDKNIHDGFDEFWSAYPNRTGKAQAQKAWSKHKPDLQVILDALEWQKETDGWKRGFVPMASTYINNARWEDENSNDKLNDIFAGAI
jgi:hypothetical protein